MGSGKSVWSKWTGENEKKKETNESDLVKIVCCCCRRRCARSSSSILPVFHNFPFHSAERVQRSRPIVWRYSNSSGNARCSHLLLIPQQNLSVANLLFRNWFEKLQRVGSEPHWMRSEEKLFRIHFWGHFTRVLTLIKYLRSDERVDIMTSRICFLLLWCPIISRARLVGDDITLFFCQISSTLLNFFYEQQRKGFRKARKEAKSWRKMSFSRHRRNEFLGSEIFCLSECCFFWMVRFPPPPLWHIAKREEDFARETAIYFLLEKQQQKKKSKFSRIVGTRSETF